MWKWKQHQTETASSPLIVTKAHEASAAPLDRLWNEGSEGWGKSPQGGQMLSYTCLEPSAKDVGSGVSQWGPSFLLSVCSHILSIAVGWLDASASGIHVMTSWKPEKGTFLGGLYVPLHPRPHTQTPLREVSAGDGALWARGLGARPPPPFLSQGTFPWPQVVAVAIGDPEEQGSTHRMWCPRQGTGSKGWGLEGGGEEKERAGQCAPKRLTKNFKNWQC